MATPRKTEARACAECGEVFSDRHANAVTCSAVCKENRLRRQYRLKMRRNRGVKLEWRLTENRDAEASKVKERERWRRGQAARRERLKADA